MSLHGKMSNILIPAQCELVTFENMKGWQLVYDDGIYSCTPTVYC